MLARQQRIARGGKMRVQPRRAASCRLVLTSHSPQFDRLTNLLLYGMARIRLHFLASSSMKEFREDLTDAVVIDLGRLPSHGREAGVFLRASKSTRLIPLLFVCMEGFARRASRATRKNWRENGQTSGFSWTVSPPPSTPRLPAAIPKSKSRTRTDPTRPKPKPCETPETVSIRHRQRSFAR